MENELKYLIKRLEELEYNFNKTNVFLENKVKSTSKKLIIYRILVLCLTLFLGISIIFNVYQSKYNYQYEHSQKVVNNE